MKMKALLMFSFETDCSYGRYCHEAIIADVDEYDIEEIKSYTPANSIEWSGYEYYEIIEQIMHDLGISFTYFDHGSENIIETYEFINL